MFMNTISKATLQKFMLTALIQYRIITMKSIIELHRGRGAQGTVLCAIHNNVYGDNYFAINKVTPEFIKNATENVSVTNGKMCEYFYHTKNETEISGICIECDEGYLYIRSSSFRELEIFYQVRDSIRRNL